MYQDTIIQKISFGYEKQKEIARLIAGINKGFCPTNPVRWGTFDRSPVIFEGSKIIRTQDEVNAYYTALEFIDSYNGDLCESFIQQIHCIVHSGRGAGRYKTVPNDMRVRLLDPDTGPVLIKTVPPGAHQAGNG